MKFIGKGGLILVFGFIFFQFTPHAFAVTANTSTVQSLDEQISSYSVYIVLLASIVLVVFSALSLKIKKLTANTKKILFSTITGVVVLTTLFLSASTIYLNTVSSSSGPVHWHADFQVWACGKEYDLKDPKGLSNKIGTATLHEHNDKRIHLEGVVVSKQDASLGKFFTVIGGLISSGSLLFPVNNGMLSVSSGGVCPDSSRAELQVFVYKVKNGIYYQQKLDDPASYIISPQSTIPPGDCIIIEFDSPKEKTDKLCTSFKVAEQLGKIKPWE